MGDYHKSMAGRAHLAASRFMMKNTLYVKDITKWRETVHAPRLDYSDAEWEPFIKEAEKIDRNEYFVTQFIAPGIFEQCHYLQEIQNALINFYEEPEYTQELIDYLTEWELEYAEKICKYIKTGCTLPSR